MSMKQNEKPITPPDNERAQEIATQIIGTGEKPNWLGIGITVLGLGGGLLLGGAALGLGWVGGVAGMLLGGAAGLMGSYSLSKRDYEFGGTFNIEQDDRHFAEPAKDAFIQSQQRQLEVTGQDGKSLPVKLHEPAVIEPLPNALMQQQRADHEAILAIAFGSEEAALNRRLAAAAHEPVNRNLRQLEAQYQDYTQLAAHTALPDAVKQEAANFVQHYDTQKRTLLTNFSSALREAAVGSNQDPEKLSSLPVATLITELEEHYNTRIAQLRGKLHQLPESSLVRKPGWMGGDESSVRGYINQSLSAFDNGNIAQMRASFEDGPVYEGLKSSAGAGSNATPEMRDAARSLIEMEKLVSQRNALYDFKSEHLNLLEMAQSTFASISENVRQPVTSREVAPQQPAPDTHANTGSVTPLEQAEVSAQAAALDVTQGLRFVFDTESAIASQAITPAIKKSSSSMVDKNSTSLV